MSRGSEVSIVHAAPAYKQILFLAVFMRFLSVGMSALSILRSRFFRIDSDAQRRSNRKGFDKSTMDKEKGSTTIESSDAPADIPAAGRNPGRKCSDAQLRAYRRWDQKANRIYTVKIRLDSGIPAKFDEALEKRGLNRNQYITEAIRNQLIKDGFLE